jgi:hypothetical protein
VKASIGMIFFPLRAGNQGSDIFCLTWGLLFVQRVRKFPFVVCA